MINERTFFSWMFSSLLLATVSYINSKENIMADARNERKHNFCKTEDLLLGKHTQLCAFITVHIKKKLLLFFIGRLPFVHVGIDLLYIIYISLN